MAGLKGLTINTAPEAEPHLYAEDDAAIYQAICGADGVFQIGQQCESQVISNNKVRVKDGVIIVGGHFARIPYGDYIDFEIANGQTGKKRNDILIAKFVTTGSGGIDTFTGEVKQGAAATGEATDPALTQNDLYQGGKIREMPLYRVKLDGLSITEVEPMFDLIPTIPTLNSYLSDLSEKSMEYYNSGLDHCIRFPDKKIQVCFGTMSATVALSANGSGATGTARPNKTFLKPFSTLASLILGNASNDWMWVVNKAASNTAIETVTLGYFQAYSSRQFYLNYIAFGAYTE